MTAPLPIDPDSVKGFLHPEEGTRLYELALAAAQRGPCLEVGSYCGKSTLYLGSGCRRHGQLLFAVDHHRGSEEHQPGEEYHDPELLDAMSGRVDSLYAFRDTLARADLEDETACEVNVRDGQHGGGVEGPCGLFDYGAKADQSRQPVFVIDRDCGRGVIAEPLSGIFTFQPGARIALLCAIFAHVDVEVGRADKK